MSQAKYVKGLLEKFRMDQCKSAAVPLQQNIKLQCEDGSKAADATLHRQLVGSLIYLTTTRLDLAYAVSMLSQFTSKPLERHWNATKNVLRYLQGTVDYGIIYTDSSDVRLAGFADSNLEGNVDDRRSITGYAFSLGSGVITWSNKKQNAISLSSAVAEYQAMCAATCNLGQYKSKLKLEKVSSLAKDTKIKYLEDLVIEMGYDPSNINVVEELVKKKNVEVSALRKQLKVPASEDPMTKDIEETETQKSEMMNLITKQNLQIKQMEEKM
eukprot:PITA_32704